MLIINCQLSSCQLLTGNHVMDIQLLYLLYVILSNTRRVGLLSAAQCPLVMSPIGSSSAIANQQ